MIKKLLIFTFTFLILVNNSCKKEEKPDPPTPNKEIIINELTRIMPAESRQYIESIDTSDFTFVFNGGDDFVNDLAVGNILVDSMSQQSPYGYLRKIISVSTEGGNKTIQTEAVRLTEAVPQGSINFHTGQLKRSMIRSMKLADGVTLNENKDMDFTVFDFGFNKVLVDPNNSSRKVTINGNTALTLDFFFDFDWEWDFNSCPTITNPLNGTCLSVSIFETGVEINQSASISIVSEVGADFDEELEIASFTFDPWVFMIANFPVVFVPKISLILNANGEIVAVFSASASENVNGKLGVKWNSSTSSFEGINEWTKDFDYTAPQLEIDAKAEAHIGPEISLLLYNAIGPYVNLTACENFEATINTGTGKWDLEFGVGLAAEIGLMVDILAWEQNFTFDPPDVSGVNNQFCLGYWSLLHLENETFENAIYISSPFNNSSINLGMTVNIETDYTGVTPDEVKFYIDGGELYSDTDDPFVFAWNTTNYTLGEHTIMVEEYINGSMVSGDESTITLQTSFWVEEDLNYVMTQSAEYLRFQSMDFKGNEAWLSGTYASQELTTNDLDVGFLWHSTDGGNTWEEIYTYSMEGFGGGSDESTQTIRFVNSTIGYMIHNNVIDGPLIGGQTDLPHLCRTTDGGESFSAVSWNSYLQYQIVYQVKDLLLNNNGELVCRSDPMYNGVISVYQDAIDTLIRVGGSEISLDYDQYWDIQGKGNTMMAFDYDSPNYLLSVDGGYNWNEYTLPAANYQGSYAFLSTSFVSEDIAFVSFIGGEYYSNQFPIIIKTIDAGNSWEVYEVTSLEGANNRFDFIHFMSEEEGFAWGNELNSDGSVLFAGIYNTTDGGQNWNRIYEIPEVIPRSSAVNKGGLFFNGTTDGFAISNSIGHKIYHFKTE